LEKILRKHRKCFDAQKNPLATRKYRYSKKNVFVLRPDRIEVGLIYSNVYTKVHRYLVDNDLLTTFGYYVKLHFSVFLLVKLTKMLLSDNASNSHHVCRQYNMKTILETLRTFCAYFNTSYLKFASHPARKRLVTLFPPFWSYSQMWNLWWRNLSSAARRTFSIGWPYSFYFENIFEYSAHLFRLAFDPGFTQKFNCDLPKWQTLQAKLIKNS